MCSTELCLSRKVGLDNLQWSLPTSTILWLHYSHSSISNQLVSNPYKYSLCTTDSSRAVVLHTFVNCFPSTTNMNKKVHWNTITYTLWWTDRPTLILQCVHWTGSLHTGCVIQLWIDHHQKSVAGFSESLPEHLRSTKTPEV